MSSSRNPDLVDEYARTAFERGLKVVVCSTGLSGHLAAAVAARTVLPVIGIPIATSPQMVGNEALAITAQMPTGVPIATVGVDAAVNAAILAAEILGVARRRGAGEALEVQGRPRGGPQAVIDRYDVPEVSAVWSDGARMANWLAIELAAVEAWAALGVVPEEDARACRERASFEVEAVQERERVTRHDVAAFVDVVAASIGEEGRWIHYGMTSSDVLDTGLALQLRASADVLLADLEALLAVVKRRALEFRDTVCMGRSHGIHAEPTSFGHKLAVFAFQLDRDRDAAAAGARGGRRRRDQRASSGSYASVDPEVERLVCERARSAARRGLDRR